MGPRAKQAMAMHATLCSILLHHVSLDLRLQAARPAERSIAPVAVRNKTEGDGRIASHRIASSRMAWDGTA